MIIVQFTFAIGHKKLKSLKLKYLFVINEMFVSHNNCFLYVYIFWYFNYYGTSPVDYSDEYMIVIHINYNKDIYCSLIVTIPLLHLQNTSLVIFFFIDIEIVQKHFLVL